MAIRSGLKFRGIAKLIRSLTPVPELAYRAWVRDLRRSSRGLRRLAKAVPVDTGRLAASWRMRVGRESVTVENVDPAAGWIRYKRKRRYGARTPRGTLRGWVNKDARPLAYRAAQRILRRRTR